jgi:hypothetical protein
MNLLSAIELSSVLFAAGAALAILILLKRSFRQSGHGPGAYMTRVARPDKMQNPIDDARGSLEFERFEVRMQELMREHSARLDSKMLALQALLNEADETIAKLDDAANRAKNTGE